MTRTLKITLLKPEARVPTYAHPGEDAAFDIYSCEERVLMPAERHKFNVGIASEFPPEYFLKIEGKSGLADKFGLAVLGGVIDAGYRGEWGIILANLGTKNLFIFPGDKIAQGVLLLRPSFQIELVAELEPSRRGHHGFGSDHRALQ
jgi:dUTP pyrophosphatase